MTHRISQSIAHFFVQKNMIEEKYVNIYSYGFEIIISDLVLLLLSFMIMFIFDLSLVMVIYLILFIILRHQAGGYHASTHFSCNCIFLLNLGAVLVLLKAVPVEYTKIIVIILSIISLILIYRLAPVTNKNRPVKSEKIKRFRKNSIIISVTILLISVITIYILKLPRIALSEAAVVFSVAVALLAETIKQRRRKE